MSSANSASTVIPAFRYRDAPAAIEWLCRAFGFERHAVYEDGTGGIAHAQLRFGNGMIMLGSERDDAAGKQLVSPTQSGGRNTVSLCCIVGDVDAHHAQALAAGARIVDAPHDPEYGGRAYSCHDPEGFLWWFGSYDPWKD